MSVEEHPYDLQTIPPLLTRAGMSLKLKKCFYFEDRIGYLVNLSRSGRLAIWMNTASGIQGLQNRTNVTRLKSFLSFCVEFRRLVSNFAIIAAFIDGKLEKDQSLFCGQLNEMEIEVLSNLQQGLLSSTISSLPQPNRRYTANIEACDKEVGCVLLQEMTEGPAKPMRY